MNLIELSKANMDECDHMNLNCLKFKLDNRRLVRVEGQNWLDNVEF